MTCDFDCGPVLSQKEDGVGHIMSMFPTDAFVLAMCNYKKYSIRIQFVA